MRRVSASRRALLDRRIATAMRTRWRVRYRRAMTGLRQQGRTRPASWARRMRARLRRLRERIDALGAYRRRTFLRPPPGPGAMRALIRGLQRAGRALGRRGE